MLGEFAKYAFCGLKRKRRDFERSVLKYVSIKNRILTQSGQKRRVCVNALDRLTPPAKTLPLPLPFLSLSFCFSCLPPARHQKLVVELPSLNSPSNAKAMVGVE